MPAPITETTEQSGQPEHSPANDELPEVSLTFVSPQSTGTRHTAPR